ncbi:hypothetical protein [Marinicrinis sediminis]|uniref:Uncharacterized protein n=1 Tax=Marinicrinis sediminis TaxID=1652465 RepID=A0ABW5RA16_9BACL
MFEILGSIYLMFTLFKLEFHRYLPKVLFIAFILCQMSYYLREEFGIASGIVTISYEVMLTLLLWLLIGMRLRYAIILSTSIIICTVVVQSILILIGVYMGVAELEEFRPYTRVTESLMVISTTLFVMISWWIKRKQIHIPIQIDANQPIRGKKPYRFMLVMILIFILVNWFFYLHLMQNVKHTLAFSVFMLLEFILMLIFFIRHEKHSRIKAEGTVEESIRNWGAKTMVSVILIFTLNWTIYTWVLQNHNLLTFVNIILFIEFVILLIMSYRKERVAGA